MGAGRRFGRWAVVSQIGVVGLAVAAVGVLPAHAAVVGCGSVLTANTTLTQDLTCTSGDGLVIAASGITIDLKGHTLTGGPGTAAGIRIAYGGFTGVTVQNGSIVGFNQGVVADTADQVHITKLRVQAIDQGILLANTAHSLVDKNVVTVLGRDGIKVDGGGNTITQNTVSSSPFGVSVSNYSTGNVVSKNVLIGNRDWAVAVFQGAATTLVTQNQISGSLNGILLDGNATGTTVSQNTISGASNDGVLVAIDTSVTQISQNTSSGNGNDGIDVQSASTTITKNTAYDNAGAGIVAVTGVTDGGGNTAYDNGSACVGVICSSP